MLAQTDVGGVGIFGKEYGDLSRAHMQQALRHVAIKYDVFVGIVSLLDQSQVSAICPTYGLDCLDRYMDVNILAMGFETRMLARQQAYFFALDSHTVADFNATRSECLGIIVLEIV